jgi:hypothetical protein
VHAASIAARLSGRLLDLAEKMRRLDPPGRHDPEQFRRDKDRGAGAGCGWGSGYGGLAAVRNLT